MFGLIMLALALLVIPAAMANRQRMAADLQRLEAIEGEMLDRHTQRSAIAAGDTT
jgi:hypothetical protein